jgi:hypothetical protein
MSLESAATHACQSGLTLRSSAGPNAIPTLRRRAQNGQLTWFGPLVMVGLIGVLAALVGLGLQAYFAATGTACPGEAAVALINI